MTDAEQSQAAGQPGGEDLPLRPGDRFGDFQIDGLLGRGGMGAVYLAHSPDGSPFAIKIMYPGKMTHDLRVRFAREAEFAMNIRHENLISVYDVGEDPDTGLCYIIMDYIDGGSLADLIREKGRLPVEEAVGIAVHVASALEVAHRSGLVHRDVKPDNVMFTSDGTPKLADLGVAKFSDERATMVTMANMVIGTPAYMSPEQLIDSHNIDARSDICSLGIILYEMLSGERPSSGSTAVELLAKAIKGEPIPDVRTVCPEVPAQVAHALSVICAPRAEGRPSTALEAASLLGRALEGGLDIEDVSAGSADAAKVPARRLDMRNVVLYAAVAVGFMAVLAVGVVGWYKALNSSPANTPAPAAPGSSAAQPAPESSPAVPAAPVSPSAPVVAASPRTESAPPVAQGGPQTVDGRVRSAVVGPRTWFYTVENGEAVIGRGRRGYDSEVLPAVEPATDAVLSIPSELDGFKVAKIGDLAFFGYGSLESISIPEGVREIRSWSFLNCGSLKTLNLPSSLEGIGDSAFEHCRSLEAIDIVNCARLSGGAFGKCPNLSRISVSDSNPAFVGIGGALYTKDRGTLVFYPRTAPEVLLPGSLTAVGAGAFEACRNIVRVKLPGSVRKIGPRAFSMCRNLVSVDLGDGVSEVGDSAFFSCSSLKETVSPRSVAKIGVSLFGGCDALRTVTFLGDAPSIAGSARNSVFGNAPEDLEVVARRGTKGWLAPHSAELPERWPVGESSDSRPIRFLDAPGGAADRGTAAQGAFSGASPEEPRHSSRSPLQWEFRTGNRGRRFMEVSHGSDGPAFKESPYTLDRLGESFKLGAEILTVTLGLTKDGVLYSVCDGDLANVSSGTGGAWNYTSREFERLRVRRRNGKYSGRFARLEDLLRAGRRNVLFHIRFDWGRSDAPDVARALTSVLGQLDAWESVVLDLRAVGVARAIFGEEAWSRMRSGELQVVVPSGMAREWSGGVSEFSVCVEDSEAQPGGLGDAVRRIAAEFSGVAGQSGWADDEDGWREAMRQGVSVFATSRPNELRRFLSLLR